MRRVSAADFLINEIKLNHGDARAHAERAQANGVRVPELEIMLDEDDAFIYDVFVMLKNRCAQGGEFVAAQMIEYQSIYYFCKLFDLTLLPNEIKYIMTLDVIYNNTIAGLKK